MGDYLSPGPAAKPGPRRGYALAVIVAGALLVFCAILPWAGIQASSDLIGSGITVETRGIDDTYGVYTLITGLAAVAAGVAGLVRRVRVAAFAIVPGGLGVALLVLFVARPRGTGDRLSVDLGEVLSIEPVIRYGWFAALACALAVVGFGIMALVPRRR